MPIADWLPPDFVKRLESLELSIRWVRAGNQIGGRFAINRRGSSVEFADYLPYAEGDDIRSIDWNLYARLDRLYVKTYKEEIALSVELIVDGSGSMALPSAEKFKRARRIAVSLGYVAVSSGHHARLTVCAPGQIASGPWCHQRGDLLRMAEQADSLKVGGNLSISDWFQRAVPLLKMRGGQAILLTDGMMRPVELFRALHVLMKRNMEIKIIQILSPEELHPGSLLRSGTLVDAETGRMHHLGYSAAELEKAMADHNELLRRFCRRHGVMFVQHRLDEPLETFIIKSLPAHGFLE